MIYLVNAFSLNMLDINGPVELEVFPLQTEDDVLDMLATYRNFTSAIGHKETADVISNMFSINIEHNRATVKLSKNDVAIVAQYRGPRLEEGATELPKGAEIKFYLVRVKENL